MEHYELVSELLGYARVSTTDQTLDLQSDAGRAELERIVATADVFITNTRVAALTRLDLHPDALRSRYPGLVYGIITGYGLDGPDAHRPGYDVGAFWARSGLGAALVPKGALKIQQIVPGATISAGEGVPQVVKPKILDPGCLQGSIP